MGAREPFPVVAIGASAGGLEALQDFFDHMSTDSGMAFVVIQHVSAEGKSMLGSLLSKHTRMEVLSAGDRMRVEPNRIYLNPPGSDVSIFDGELLLTEPEKGRGARYPIDLFFRSLARDLDHKSVCVVMSGTGSDGTLGLRAVKEAGGWLSRISPGKTKDAKWFSRYVMKGRVIIISPRIHAILGGSHAKENTHPRGE